MNEGNRIARVLPCRNICYRLATPILRIDSSPPERMDAEMRPIGYASHPSVFYRVPLDISDLTVEVGFITDEMFPKRRAQDSAREKSRYHRRQRPDAM